MSLVKCSECGKEISDKANVCPNCGGPISHKYKIILTGYSDTDTAAMAGLKATLGMDLHYDDAADILNSCPNELLECDSLDQAKDYAIKLQKATLCIEVLDKKGNVIEVKNSNSTYKEETGNSVAGAIKGIGYFILILGTVGSLIFGDNATGYRNNFSLIHFIIAEFFVIISGMVFLGFSEIIGLLHDIRNKLD